MQVISSFVIVSISHVLPSILMAISTADVPKFLPYIVTVVPPCTAPYLGEIESTTAVTSCR